MASSVRPMTMRAMPMLSGKLSMNTFSWGNTRARMPRTMLVMSSRASTGALNLTPSTNMWLPRRMRVATAPPEKSSGPGGSSW